MIASFLFTGKNDILTVTIHLKIRRTTHYAYLSTKKAVATKRLRTEL